MKIKLLLPFLIFLSIGAKAQEISCRVVINSQQIQTTERRVFDEMEKVFADFINDRTWTNDRFQNQEKIKCVFQLTLESSPEIGRYRAAFQAISVRPVFNTTYETTIVNFADRDFEFEYNESQPMNFSENTYSSNITSLLAYYAYMILAYDYDSFSKGGGDPYYDLASQVIANAQGVGAGGGWDQFSNVRNRYWWTNDGASQTMAPFREAVYEYHRKGLDLLQEDEEKGRTNILEAIKKIQEANRVKPRTVLVISFLDAKADEMVSVFSEGDIKVRREAFDILKQIDPAKTEKFRKIMEN